MGKRKDEHARCYHKAIILNFSHCSIYNNKIMLRFSNSKIQINFMKMNLYSGQIIYTNKIHK